MPNHEANGRSHTLVPSIANFLSREEAARFPDVLARLIEFRSGHSVCLAGWGLRFVDIGRKAKRNARCSALDAEWERAGGQNLLGARKMAKPLRVHCLARSRHQVQ
jgi:hypothetical protein